MKHESVWGGSSRRVREERVRCVRVRVGSFVKQEVGEGARVGIFVKKQFGGGALEGVREKNDTGFYLVVYV